ncbi:hypothetical protein Leryth_008929, partial [Lithospermum erythrorhizon]
QVFLCFGNSVASTRFLLQDEFNIQTTQCDNCIIGFHDSFNVACIFHCIVGGDELQEASQILSCLADMQICSVCACMQTQHKVEMDKRDGKFGPQPAMAVPPAQQMSRVDQPYPPPVGQPPVYNQPPVYGQPAPSYGQPYNHPPPQAQGYPAPNYPPSNYPPAGYPPPGYHK